MDLGKLMIALMKSELRTRKSTQEIRQRPVPPPLQLAPPLLPTSFNQLLQIAGTEKREIKKKKPCEGKDKEKVISLIYL